MTLRQNKVAIRLGNFVFHGDDFGVIIKRDETIVGDVWTFMSLSSGDITMLREHQLTPYTRRKNGTVPAENMSDKQRRAIGLIENSLQIHFNGRTIGDVSTFIDLLNHNRWNKLERTLMIHIWVWTGLMSSTANRNLRVLFFLPVFNCPISGRAG